MLNTNLAGSGGGIYAENSVIEVATTMASAYDLAFIRNTAQGTGNDFNYGFGGGVFLGE